MTHKHVFRQFIIAILACFLLAPLPGSPLVGDAIAGVKKVKPPKESRRPSLSYQPVVTQFPTRYPGTLGVLAFRDKRAMKFYGGRDDYFAENVLPALSNSLYLELKSSRAFASVRQITGQPELSMDRAKLAELAAQNGVDYLFIADLTAFNMLREKMNKAKQGEDFRIDVHFGMVGQLVDARTGIVLWSEAVQRQDGTLNTDKRVTEEDYGPGAINAVRNGFADMRNSIHSIGLVLKQ